MPWYQQHSVFPLIPFLYALKFHVRLSASSYFINLSTALLMPPPLPLTDKTALSTFAFINLNAGVPVEPKEAVSPRLLVINPMVQPGLLTCSLELHLRTCSQFRIFLKNRWGGDVTVMIRHNHLIALSINAVCAF